MRRPHSSIRSSTEPPTRSSSELRGFPGLVGGLRALAGLPPKRPSTCLPAQELTSACCEKAERLFLPSFVKEGLGEVLRGAITPLNPPSAKGGRKRRDRSCNGIRTTALTCAMSITLLACIARPARSQGIADYERDPDRIVKTFDFDERADGNLEDIPEYWEPLEAKEFAHFAYGQFDFNDGHDAPPSFRLVSEGRSVAYEYRGGATRVRAKSEYRITGYIKPTKLHYGRACLSANFLNIRGEPIDGIFARSRFVGGTDTDGDWVRVDFYLPAAPPQAYTIGLVAWVLQDSEWNTEKRSRRYIPHKDVFGSALFDDIAIYTLPRVELSSTGLGNVLTGSPTEALRALVADNGESSLRAKLSIFAVDGGLVEIHPIDVALGSTVEPTRVPIHHLAPGLYAAQIDVTDHDDVVISRRLRFLRLAPDTRKDQPIVTTFGIVLTPDDRAPYDTEFALLQKLGIGAVKLPVWSGRPDEDDSLEQRRALGKYLQELAKNGYDVTAVLAGPPAPIVQAGGRFTRPLIDLLADEPTAWEDHLAAVAAPYASVFRSWQIDSDDDTRVFSPQKLTVAIQHFRDAIRRYIHTPAVAYPSNPHVDFGSNAPQLAETTIRLDPSIDLHDYDALVAARRDSTTGRVHAYVPTTPASTYRRDAEIAAWARSILTARHAGADTVYTSQLWSVRRTVGQPVIEPSEQFLVLRTIARTLGHATPGPKLNIADGVTALAFRKGDEMVIAAWDALAFHGPRTHALQLGASPTHTDLWGSPMPIRALADGRHEVELGPMPTIISHVAPWVVDLRAAVRLTPHRIDSGREGQRFELEIPYRGDRSVTGTIELKLPDGWDAEPDRFEFSVMPQRMEHRTIDVQIPHSTAAGVRTIVAALTTSDRQTYMEVPLKVSVDLSDVDVSGMAVIEGDVLKLRQVVTNRSDSILSFRGSASVPGRERKYRPFTNLRPGDSQTVEYRFDQASDLIGRAVRLDLRELNDGPRSHSLDIIVP